MSDVEHCSWWVVGRWRSRVHVLVANLGLALHRNREISSCQYNILVLMEVMKSRSHQKVDEGRCVVWRFVCVFSVRGCVRSLMLEQARAASARVR
jgi:hypothetical protein